MRILLRWAASAAALLVVAALVPGITVASWPTAFVAAVVIGLVNGVLGPVVRFFSFPITLFTLGLFSLVISAALFGLAAYLVPGFEADSIVSAFVGALAYGLVSWGLQRLVGTKNRG